VVGQGQMALQGALQRPSAEVMEPHLHFLCRLGSLGEFLSGRQCLCGVVRRQLCWLDGMGEDSDKQQLLVSMWATADHGVADSHTLHMRKCSLPGDLPGWKGFRAPCTLVQSSSTTKAMTSAQTLHVGFSCAVCAPQCPSTLAVSSVRVPA
jgi:hypothetical protein